MSDLMNLYFIKQHILEIKLELAKVAIEKQNCIKNQYYEKAFELREKEKTLRDDILNQVEVFHKQKRKLPTSPQNMEQHDLLLSILYEIGSIDPDRVAFKILRDEFVEDIRHKLILLNEMKKNHELQNRFADATEIQKQILGIGEFLHKVG
ncbi:MAG: hypothetical protein FGM14_01365 [Flavobacteriales bacterium]|nr:hypothetical protein [Flavobacteriales bacterium]